MKFFYPTFLIIVFLYSCNEKDQTNSNYKDSTTIDISLKDKQKADSFNIKDSTLNENILGVWGIIGEHKSSFIIDKMKIFYPEKNIYYSYKILNDSLNISSEDADVCHLKLN